MGPRMSEVKHSLEEIYFLVRTVNGHDGIIDLRYAMQSKPFDSHVTFVNKSQLDELKDKISVLGRVDKMNSDLDLQKQFNQIMSKSENQRKHLTALELSNKGLKSRNEELEKVLRDVKALNKQNDGKEFDCTCEPEVNHMCYACGRDFIIDETLGKLGPNE